MSLPFKISNPRRIPPGGAWAVTKEEIDQISKQNDALIEIRGKVITSSLLIEQKLDTVISMVFMGNEVSVVDLFKELLLEKEFFTFMNKWRTFRDLTKRKHVNFSNEEDRKKTLEKIKKIIEIRDRFAHGDIVFMGTQPTLKYVSEGERKSQILDDSYFDSLNLLFYEVDQTLTSLIDFLPGESEETVDE